MRKRIGKGRAVHKVVMMRTLNIMMVRMMMMMKMLMMMVIAMTINNDYWKLRIQHHMRKRIRKCTAVHRVVMMAMIDMMMIVLPINDKRKER